MKSKSNKLKTIKLRTKTRTVGSYFNLCRFVRECKFKIKDKYKQKYSYRIIKYPEMEPEKLKIKKEKYYSLTIKGPSSLCKFTLTKNDLYNLRCLIFDYYVLVFYVLVLVHRQLKYVSFFEAFNFFFKLKNLYYFLYNYYDDYLNFDEEFFNLNLSYFFDSNYIKHFNLNFIYNSKKLNKFSNFETYYGIDKKTTKEGKEMILAYTFDFNTHIPNFLDFCMLEMCLLKARITSFHVHYFQKFKNTNSRKLNNKLILYSKFYLKADFLYYYDCFDYLMQLRRVRFQEYVRMHSFFVKNFKLRKFFMEVLYVTRAPHFLNVKDEITWYKKNINAIQDNYNLYSSSKRFYNSFVQVDLNALNIVLNNKMFMFQKKLNRLDSRFHKGIKWMFSSSEKCYHVFNCYFLTMDFNYTYEFYFMFFRFTSLEHYFKFMIPTFDLRLLYFSEIAIKKETAFVNKIYQQMIPYYFYMDLWSFSNFLYYKKLNTYSFFFYRICDLLILKVKSSLRYKMSIKGYEGTHPDCDAFEFFMLLDSLFDKKSNLVLLFDTITEPKMSSMSLLYNTIGYINWRLQYSTYNSVCYPSFSYTYYNLKSTYDSIFYNRFKGTQMYWRMLMHLYVKQKWNQTKLMRIPRVLPSPSDTKESFKLKVQEREYLMNEYKNVNFFEKILYVKLFKHLFFQLIYENAMDFDPIIYFFLSKNRVLLSKYKFCFFGFEKFKKFLTLRQDCIFVKDLYPYKRNTKADITAHIIDSFPNTNMLSESKFLKTKIYY